MFPDLRCALEYRLLRAVAHSKPCSEAEPAYRGKSKLRTLLGDGVFERVRDRYVIDFGCGEGEQAVEIALAGAARVVGLDIQTDLLQRARERAERAGVASRCEFVTSTPEKADLIISLDAFEHYGDPVAVLRQMARMLKSDGCVEIVTGPPWYHPRGGHLFSVFPWAHAIFSERALIRWRNEVRSDGATRFRDVKGGLNGMTVKGFERWVADSPLRIQSLELRPIRSLATFHCRLTREFFTSAILCRLVPKDTE
jgi:SAM-dependent methyltransferase